MSMLVPGFLREFVRRKVLRPLLRMLRGGVTPRRMAWSLALGMVIGISPSVGIPTLVLIVVAWIFRLDQMASQVGFHAMAPLHFLLFIPFIQLGVHLFHTNSLEMSRREFEHLSHHPWRMLHDIWRWEWHALIVWGVVGAIMMPLLAMFLRRWLVMLMRKHQTSMRSRMAMHS